MLEIFKLLILSFFLILCMVEDVFFLVLVVLRMTCEFGTNKINCKFVFGISVKKVFDKLLTNKTIKKLSNKDN